MLIGVQPGDWLGLMSVQPGVWFGPTFAQLGFWEGEMLVQINGELINPVAETPVTENIIS